MSERQHGFTLMEAIIVLVLIGILAAGFRASTMTLTPPDAELRREAVKLVSRIAHVRLSAALSGRERTLKLESHSLQYDDDSLQYDDQIVLPIGDTRVMTFEGLTFSKTTLTFSAYGLCTSCNQNGETVTLTTKKGETAVIKIHEGGFAEVAP